MNRAQQDYKNAVRMILAKWIESKSYSADYYANLNSSQRHDLSEHRGQNADFVAGYYSGLYEEAYRDYIDYCHWLETGKIDPLKFLNEQDHLSLMNAAKQVIREAMMNAYGWTSNVHIWILYAREALAALQILRKYEPKYEVVTARYFLY